MTFTRGPLTPRTPSDMFASLTLSTSNAEAADMTPAVPSFSISPPTPPNDTMGSTSTCKKDDRTSRVHRSPHLSSDHDLAKSSDNQSSSTQSTPFNEFVHHTQNSTPKLRPIRALTPKEAHHLTLLLTQHLFPHRHNPKQLMKESIELAEKLHEAGVRWDKWRRVMGMHLRGIWEEGGGGGVGGRGRGMDLYVQGSFLTIAEEPHPFDTMPLPIPLHPASYTALPKLTLQAGLFNALPIGVDHPGPAPITQPVENGGGRRLDEHGGLIGSIAGVANLHSLTKSGDGMVVDDDRDWTGLGRDSDGGRNHGAGRALTNGGNGNQSDSHARHDQDQHQHQNKQQGDKAQIRHSRPMRGFGFEFELHEGMQLDHDHSHAQNRITLRKGKKGRWNERKKRVGLSINVDGHQKSSHSHHTPQPYSASSSHFHSHSALSKCLRQKSQTSRSRWSRKFNSTKTRIEVKIGKRRISLGGNTSSSFSSSCCSQAMGDGACITERGERGGGGRGRGGRGGGIRSARRVSFGGWEVR
ncbi:hypothetical protein IAR55_005814 [Kwoniella newhampshirensis]|uniref:Uncharacterized protein n=1 Tax=Kwoniella newhampshirensis TaxID=1651941 RepID=A0AAW0YGV5_9TREE